MNEQHIEDIITALYDLIQDARTMPLAADKCIIERDKALEILKKLSQDTSTAYGAEAAYMLILDAYDRGEFQEVEDRVYAFSDSASGQTYWLAKSFVVLGDSFADRGEFKQAKATFDSIKEGYAASKDGDDVKEAVDMRLSKLESVMNEMN